MTKTKIKKPRRPNRVHPPEIKSLYLEKYRKIYCTADYTLNISDLIKDLIAEELDINTTLYIGGDGIFVKYPERRDEEDISDIVQPFIKDKTRYLNYIHNLIRWKKDFDDCSKSISYDKKRMKELQDELREIKRRIK